MKKRSHVAGRVLVDSIAPVFGFVMVLWIIWNVETRFFPVVTDFKIQSGFQTQQEFTAIGSLNKMRNCEMVGMTIYKAPKDKPKSIIAQYREDLFSADAGTGEHSWGPLALPLPNLTELSDTIEIVALHRCHALWLQQTMYLSEEWRNFKRYTLVPPAIPEVITPPVIPIPK